MDEKKSWRDVFPVHPAADIFPMMSEEKLRELGEDIRNHGLQEPIVLWSETTPSSGKEQTCCVLDGRNRLDAMELVGMETFYKQDDGRYHIMAGDNSRVNNQECRHGINPYEYVISKNIRRRHLIPEQCVALVSEAMGLWKSADEAGKAANATVGEPSQPVKPRGHKQPKGAVAKVAEATKLDKKTVRKHLTKIAEKKVEAGEITKEHAEAIAPKKEPIIEERPKSNGPWVRYLKGMNTKRQQAKLDAEATAKMPIGKKPELHENGKLDIADIARKAISFLKRELGHASVQEKMTVAAAILDALGIKHDATTKKRSKEVNRDLSNVLSNILETVHGA